MFPFTSTPSPSAPGYHAQPAAACSLITGNLQWSDDGAASTGDSDTTGTSGFSGLVNHLLITDNFTLPGGDTFVRVDVSVVDAWGVEVRDSITVASGAAQVNDGENGIDLTGAQVTVKATLYTANCKDGKLVQFYIVRKEAAAKAPTIAAANVAAAAGSVGKYLAFFLYKNTAPSVAIDSDEGVQAWTGSETGTFTGQTFENDDVLKVVVYDDAGGLTVLDEAQLVIDLQRQVAADVAEQIVTLNAGQPSFVYGARTTGTTYDSGWIENHSSALQLIVQLNLQGGGREFITVSPGSSRGISKRGRAGAIRNAQFWAADAADTGDASDESLRYESGDFGGDSLKFKVHFTN